MILAAHDGYEDMAEIFETLETAAIARGMSCVTEVRATLVHNE